ncbi:MAG: hypothetical protein AAGD00_10125 [Planctomycetota bacterium]
MFFSILLTVAMLGWGVGAAALAVSLRNSRPRASESCAACGFDAYHDRGRCPECGSKLALSSLELARVMQSPLRERRLWRTRRSGTTIDPRTTARGSACVLFALLLSLSAWVIGSPSTRIEAWLPTPVLLEHAESAHASREAKARAFAELRSRSVEGTLSPAHDARLAHAVLDATMQASRTARVAAPAPDARPNETVAFVDRAVAFELRPDAQPSPVRAVETEAVRRDGPKPPALFTFSRGVAQEVELDTGSPLPGDVRRLDPIGSTPGLPAAPRSALREKPDNSPFTAPELASVEDWLGDRTLDLTRGVRSPRLRSLERRNMFTVDFGATAPGFAATSKPFVPASAWDTASRSRRSNAAAASSSVSFSSAPLASPIALEPANVRAGAQRIRPTRR